LPAHRLAVIRNRAEQTCSARKEDAVDRYLPADRLAQELLMILAQGDITLPALADSLRVHPAWLHKVLTGEVTQLTLLTVVGICRQLRIMPEDIWEPGEAAEAFRGFPPNTFDPDDGS
jgi:DNA-binding Xre family transcriptional regulator